MSIKLRPTKTEERIGQCDAHEVYDHPAFGLFDICSVTGGAPHLFGSDVEHNQRIRIRIKHAKLHRNLSRDWIHDHGIPIIEIEMSQAQFAEAITSPNRHSGTPCTITAIEGEQVPEIYQLETKQELFRREIKQAAEARLAAITKQIEDLGAMIESGKLSKPVLRELHRELAREATQLPGSLEFVVGQAETAIEKAAIAKKVEIEAFASLHERRIGQAAIAANGATSPAGLAEPHYVENSAIDAK